MSGRRATLVQRLYLALLFIAALVSLAFFASTWWMERQSLEEMLQHNARALVAGLEQNIGLGLQLEEVRLIEEGAQATADIPGVRALDIYNLQGQRLLRIGAKQPQIALPRLRATRKEGMDFETLPGSDTERVIAPIYAGERELVGYSVLELSRTSLTRALKRALWLAGGVSLLLLASFLGLAWLAVRQLQRPLQTLEEAVERVAGGRLNVDIDTEFPDPLGRIARAFNRMTKALAEDRSMLQRRSQQLEHSERRYRELFTHMPVAMYMASMEGRLVQCNPAMAQMFGYDNPDEMLAEVRHMGDLYENPDDRKALISEVIERKQLISREVSLKDRAGNLLHCVLNARLVVDDHGEYIGIEGLLQDLTQLRTLESNLLQAQKMEMVGQLAGGIAHDFNNLLSIISGNTELLIRQLPESADKPRRHAEHILRACQRAAELTSNLLGFARKGAMRLETIEVAGLLREVAALVRETCDRRIAIELDTDTTVCKVIGDPGQLHQVFMNLAINATHAMPNGGTLRFVSRAVNQHTVRIDVRDTGIGMDEATLKHIFEPFFTTRERGQGTGLGLAMVQGIIEKMGGSIAVASKPGQGTCFTITLPRVHDATEQQRPALENEGQAVRGHGRILLVDDEALLRETGREMLGDAGFQVTTAENGEQAIEILARNAQAFDVVLLDLNMPGIGGAETLRAIRRQHDGLKVIVLSGYSEDTLDQQDPLLRYDGFVRKPYQFQALCAEIKRVLSFGQD